MNVLLDTGPLVAIISKEDADHQASVEAFAELRDAPITCWPVLTEAAWLLRHRLEHVETLFDFAAEGIITIVDLNVADLSIWLHRFSSNTPTKSRNWRMRPSCSSQSSYKSVRSSRSIGVTSPSFARPPASR